MSDRNTVAYWEQVARECGETGDNVLEGALCRMARREIPVSADDADRALGLTPGTTLWFNHSGFVPADAVHDELERRNAGRKRDPESGRLV